jgi:uncharacterized protein (DUF1330 family)
MERVQLIVDVDVSSGRNAVAVYVVSDVSVRNAQAVQVYRTRAADSIAKYGGKYLVRGGEVQALEGTWIPRMLIIVEFPSREQATIWYGSPEYASALEVRDIALSRSLILVDGISELG